MKTPAFLADAGARALTVLGPETAHRVTISLLRHGLGPKVPPLEGDLAARLKTQVAGLTVPNPLGLAAGFDKNAEAIAPALDLGFGFVEIGAVTPRPQPGNPKPRAFRLRSDQAVINRYGFNNDGLDMIAARLSSRTRPGVVGANLGANKMSADRAADYVIGVEMLAGLVDFYTVNVSSPNTPGLRALQDKSVLSELLAGVREARDKSAPKTPVFLKVAPDLVDADKADIADVVRSEKIDGLIVSNTTIERPSSLRSAQSAEPGGLSGQPLFAPSTALLAEFYKALDGAIPLIGVGGVASARDAYEKILKGASLVQLYTALVYQGPGLIARMLNDLPRFLDTDGFETIGEAVGALHR